MNMQPIRSLATATAAIVFTVGSASLAYSPEKLNNKTLVIDIAGSEQHAIVKKGDAADTQWEKTSLETKYFNKVYDKEKEQFRIPFKEKPGTTIKGKPMPARCTFKTLGPDIYKVDILDADEEDDGTYSLSFVVYFYSEKEGVANGRAWCAGKEYVLRNVHVSLEKK